MDGHYLTSTRLCNVTTMTIRIPDDKHSRLKALARHRHVSVNKLIEELSTQALAEFDSEVRFRTLAARDLEILDKLDTHFSED